MDDYLAAALKQMDFFHTPNGKPYAEMRTDGKRVTVATDSQDFRDRLELLYFKKYGVPPTAEELRSAVALARALAKFEGPESLVHVRVAEHDRALYLDLADPTGRCVEVSEVGRKLIETPPVRSLRPPGLLPLPEPRDGGSIDLLRSYANVADDGEFVLLVAWLLAALRPRGPYPMLLLTGEQGASKSTPYGAHPGARRSMHCSPPRAPARRA